MEGTIAGLFLVEAQKRRIIISKEVIEVNNDIKRLLRLREVLARVPISRSAWWAGRTLCHNRGDCG